MSKHDKVQRNYEFLTRFIHPQQYQWLDDLVSNFDSDYDRVAFEKESEGLHFSYVRVDTVARRGFLVLPWSFFLPNPEDE